MTAKLVAASSNHRWPAQAATDVPPTSNISRIRPAPGRWRDKRAAQVAPDIADLRRASAFEPQAARRAADTGGFPGFRRR
ncbi:MAG TPA: hypothetical protein VFE72_00350 [Lysobacter sp.]|nr:hypothetical protein [Lysobacter sp.]